MTTKKAHAPAMEVFGTAALWDAAEHVHGGWSLGHRTIPDLRVFDPNDHVAGPAYTVRMRRAKDRAVAHRAQFLRCYDEAPAGSIVVVEVANDIGGAALGDVVGHRLKAIGVAGVIIWGPIRDLAGLNEYCPPIWYRETTMAGPITTELIAESNIDVCVNGVIIHPGDYVTCDRDGAFVTPPEEKAKLLEAAREIGSREEARHRELAAGKSLQELILGKKSGH